MEPQDSQKYTGLREDIECLLQRFLQTQNVRFQMFAEEWRKLNFSFIHYGIEKGQEKKEAMQEAFQIITDFLLPPYELQRRVGALYILYALYMTQPHVPKFKIRISIDQWQSVTLLIETLESQGHLDAIYVFYKLMMSKAFMFTAKPNKMMFHTSYLEGKSDQNPTERWLDRHRHSLMTECFDDTMLEVHHEQHEQYQKMKVNLGLHDNTSLMVVRESITECIVKRFEKLEADFEASRELNQSTDTSDPDIEDRGSKISQIKARSYSTMAKPSISRRHRQQPAELHSSQNHSPAKSKVTKAKAKGKGRKGRKGQQRVTTQSSVTETSEPEDHSDDETWTPDGARKCKKMPSKKAATKGQLELLQTIRRLQVENIQTTKKSNKTSSARVSDEDVSDSNVKAESVSVSCTSEAVDQVMAPSSMTRMPCKTATSMKDISDTSLVSQTLSRTEATASSLSSGIEKGMVMSTDTKTNWKQARSSDESGTQSSLVSTTPKKTPAARKMPQKQPSKTSWKITAEKTVQSKSPRKIPEDVKTEDSTITLGKRGKSNMDCSADQGSDTSPEVSPKKKFRGSDKMNIKEINAPKGELPKADVKPQSSRLLRESTRDKTENTPATPLKKSNRRPVEEVSAETNPDRTAHLKGNNESTSGKKAHQNHQNEYDPSTKQSGVKNVGAGHNLSSTPGDQGSLPSCKGSSEVVAEQSSTATLRGLRSASGRGRGSTSPWAAGTRGQVLSPGNQRSALKKQGDLPQGRMLSPRHNTTLKIRGGGIGARTRGARQNVSK